MKKVFALATLSLLVGSSFSAFATTPVETASLKFFQDYNPADKSYSSVSVSKLSNPLSAEVLLDTTTGVCYLGTPEKVLPLVQKMVGIYNETGYHKLAITRFDVNTADDEKNTELELRIVQKTGAGNYTTTWPRIRRCVR